MATARERPTAVSRARASSDSDGRGMPTTLLWYSILCLAHSHEHAVNPAPVIPATGPRTASTSVSPASPAIELSVVVPAFNERDNVVALLERLRTTLRGVEWEVIYVDDDSPDGTADVVRACGQTDRRVRCVQRVGRRG